MATRMQQRRGTASQWTSANPVLNAGEMGWESDTNKFKIGDGTNHWADIDYFADINSTVNPAFGSSITFEGATADSFETVIQVTDPTADRTITLPNVTGTVITTGNLSDITDIGVFTSTIRMEGSSADDFELTLSAGNPTADRTITFPDETGTVITSGNLGAITSLTSPSISSPTVSGLIISDSSIVLEGATANDFETTLSVTDPTADRTITFPDVTGTVITTGNLSSINSLGVMSSIVFEGSTDDEFELTLAGGDPTADRTVSFPDAGGVVVVDTATQTLTNKTLTSPQVSGLALTDASIILEGSSPDNFETTITVIDPTADRTISIPDVTGTVTILDATQTLTNKTISLASNTVTSTLAELNTAVSDADVASLAGSETLTNKTIALGSNTVSGTIAQFNTAVTDQDLATLAGSETLTNKTISFSSNTLTGVAPLAAPALTGDATAVNLTISGNLTVNGTTTNLNSTNLVVEDKNIILADVDTPTDTTADGGGITIKGTTDKTFNWVDATDAFTSSEHINLASGKDLKVNGTAVISSTAGGFIFTDGTQTKEGTPSRTPIIQKTDSYTLSALTERDSLIEVAKGSAATITIPLNSAVAFPVGTSIDILQTSTGQVTIAGDAGVTVNSTPGLKLRTQWSTATLFKRAENTWVVYGDLTA